MVPKKSAPGEPPRCRMCVDFRKIKELQPKTQRVDKQADTQGNLSLVPLPKIDEMYANFLGAKIFTTPDLCSGYYHIALDNKSKAKTAFVTPCSSSWVSTGTCLFPEINFNCIAGL